MRIKGVLIVTLAIWFSFAGLVFHLLAMFSRRWIVSIPRKSRGPNDQIHYYSLWTRCQYSNTSYVLPDILSQPNIESFVCRPNQYLRYNSDDINVVKQCYENRHRCSSITGIPDQCHCQYLTVTRIQQWLCILVSVFLLLAIFIFYLKLIASPQNASATMILSFAPMVFLNLALLLMITTMILLAAYLRRYQYEEYDIKLPKDLFESSAVVPDTWNYYRLNLFFRTYPNSNLYEKVMSIFKSIHKDRFHVRIDWSAISEIIAILFTVVAHTLSLVLAIARVN